MRFWKLRLSSRIYVTFFTFGSGGLKPEKEPNRFELKTVTATGSMRKVQMENQQERERETTLNVGYVIPGLNSSGTKKS